MENLKISIIGSGLGGLALAQGLKKHNIDVTVFERQERNSIKQTGYRIKINQHGTEALKFCLPEHLYELYIKTSVKSPLHPFFLDAYTLKSSNKDDQVEENQSVNRFTFREVLLGELDGQIEYGYTFKSYEKLENGKIKIWFENGESHITDILIGADGANSRVRKQYKPEISVMDTDGRALYTKVYLDEQRRESLSALTGIGMRGMSDENAPAMLLLEDMKFNQPLEQHSQNIAPNVHITPQQDYLYVVFAGHKTWFDNSDETLFNLSGSELLDLAKTKTSHWHPQIAKMLDFASAESTGMYHIRNVVPYKSWKETTNILLLGDALHPMTPIGIGGNAALYDAYKLTQAFIDYKLGNKKLEDALRSYETNAITRGMSDVRTSSKGGESMFNQIELPAEDIEID